MIRRHVIHIVSTFSSWSLDGISFINIAQLLFFFFKLLITSGLPGFALFEEVEKTSLINTYLAWWKMLVTAIDRPVVYGSHF